MTILNDTVNLTQSAILEVQRMLKKETAGKLLRIYVEAGGCSGLEYGLIFDEPRENDHRADCRGMQVLVDNFSMNYLRGAIVEFSDDLNDSGFKITNPNAKQSCGCGKSFEV